MIDDDTLSFVRSHRAPRKQPKSSVITALVLVGVTLLIVTGVTINASVGIL